jgi:hypothetical protein
VGIEASLSVLVHAESKIGKSTLGNTSPAPRLIVDAEGGSKFLPGRKIVWDVRTQNCPMPDGTWDTCIVTIRDYSDMTRVYDWLNSGKHGFKSVVIDSITEIQKKCVDSLAGTDQMSQQTWGALLRSMEQLIRNLRDLTSHPTNPLMALVLIAMTREINGKMRPYVQGALQTTLPYFIDVVGYLEVVEVPNQEDPTQPPAKYRRLIVSPHPRYEAGERVQGRLGEFVWHPRIDEMINTVFPPEEQAVVAAAATA